MNRAGCLRLSKSDRRELEKAIQSQYGRARVQLKKRGQILVDLKEDSERQVAKELKVNRATVRKWKRRFQEGGVKKVLTDAPRSGRPREIKEDVRQMIKAAKQLNDSSGEPWTVRSAAKEFNVSTATVSRMWSGVGPR